MNIPPAIRRPRNQPPIKPSLEVEGPPPGPRQLRASGCHSRKARAPLDFVPAGMRGQGAPNTFPVLSSSVNDLFEVREDHLSHFASQTWRAVVFKFFDDIETLG